MTIASTFRVTARHNTPARDGFDEHVEVTSVDDGVTWHAEHPRLGYGKGHRTQVAAINSLLGDHGYHTIDATVVEDKDEEQVEVKKRVEDALPQFQVSYVKKDNGTRILTFKLTNEFGDIRVASWRDEPDRDKYDIDQAAVALGRALNGAPWWFVQDVLKQIGVKK